MKKALIIIDLQNDFLPPNGALAVPGGDEIIPIINQLMPKFEHVFATQDWHPKNHTSFASWPPHCLQDTFGAELSNLLNQNSIEKVFRKGTHAEIDSYSALLKETGLAEYLNQKGITDLYFAGLATDYCVFYSVLDALKLGFRVNVIQDACRAIGIQASERALEKMRKKGAKIVDSLDL